MDKKLILLENRYQAQEYLKNIKRFKEFTPVSFTFPVEELLLKNKIKFKTEGDYETSSIYKGIYKSSSEIVKKIYRGVKIKYKGIKLMPLFYKNLILIIMNSKKYLRLLKKIIEKEKPKEIAIFETDSFIFFDKELSSKIIKPVFKGKLNIIKYSIPKKKEIWIFKGVDFLQKIFSRIRLNFAKKSDNKIFFAGQKHIFEPVFHLLLKNKNNKIFKCYHELKKSFFIDRNYIPFYKFSGEKSIEQKRLEQEIRELKGNLKKINFTKKFGIEKELENVFKEWLFDFIYAKFLEISGLINEIISLMGENKINLILLDNDDRLFEKTITNVAKLFKIPSIILQHGALSEGGCMPIQADYILVLSEETKKWFIKNKTNKNKVKVIGCPRYDALVGKEKKNKEKIILYIVDAGSSDDFVPGINLTIKIQKWILERVFKTLKKFPEYKLVIKTRLGWDMNELPLIIAKQEKFKNLEIIKTTDNIKLLNYAEIVIINRTTMGLEALLLNKPVISILFKYLDTSNIYMNTKTVDVVYTEKQLENAIEKNKNQTKEYNFERKKFLEKQLYKLDGRASQRAVDFINEILSKNKMNKDIIKVDIAL